jgi:hypothetical protein
MNTEINTNPINRKTRRNIFLGIGAAVLAVAGWAAFRPELLFIDKKVNEALPVAASNQAAPVSISMGSFKGLAHQTTGTAAIYQLADGKQVLRLSNFKTSNGPDVRVYLVAGDDGADNTVIKNGAFLSLGELKGNDGDQNYELPANVDLKKYRSVSIWCARFAVNFGAATLMTDTAAAPKTNSVQSETATPALFQSDQSALRFQPVAFRQTAAPEKRGALLVTTGMFRRVTHNTQGTATLYENKDGSRELRLTGFKTEMGPALRVYLIAAGDAKDNKAVTKAGFIDLGKLKKLVGTQSYKVPANIDLWKYRAVTIWCNKFKVNFGTAPLAAKQS